MSFEDCRRTKFARMHFWALLVALLIAQTLPHHTHGYPDYSDDGDVDTQLGSAGGESDIQANDEIYNTALMPQELESDEQRKAAVKDEMAMETEEHTDEPSMSKASKKSKPHKNHISKEYENMTEEEEEGYGEEYEEGDEVLVKRAPATYAPTSDEYPEAHGDDDGGNEADADVEEEGIHHLAPGTTMIPEYVRKGKAKNFLHPAETDDSEENRSLPVDYAEDDGVTGQRHHQLQLPVTTKRSRSNDDFSDSNTNVPIPMKFYQSQTGDANSSEDDNKLNEAPQPIAPSREQLLPQYQRGQPFQTPQNPYPHERSTASAPPLALPAATTVPTLPTTYEPFNFNNGRMAVPAGFTFNDLADDGPQPESQLPHQQTGKTTTAPLSTTTTTTTTATPPQPPQPSQPSQPTPAISSLTTSRPYPTIASSSADETDTRTETNRGTYGVYGAYGGYGAFGPVMTGFHTELSATSTAATPQSTPMPTAAVPSTSPWTTSQAAAASAAAVAASASAYTTTQPITTKTTIMSYIPTTLTTTTTTSTSTTTKPTTIQHTSSPPPPPPPSATPSLGIATNKQGKQINISRRKLLPHEQLRNYIEDAYIRMPLAVIVDPSTESLEKTKALWNDALRTNINIKIVLVSLNASGNPSAYNFNNTRQFLAGLNSIKEHPSGGNAFIGIVHASELVPYDSAVFISTAAIPPHTELVQDAAITLLKKRIRLYLIWFGERSISENETQDAVGGILGEVAIRSGGDILHIVGSDSLQELEGSTLTLVADAFRGIQEVDIPVDTTLSSLHVKIDAPMRTVTLETPNGDINLKKLVKFKTRTHTVEFDDQRLDAFVPLTKLRKNTIFKLKTIPETIDDEYSVFVRADRKADLFLDDMIKHFDNLFMTGLASYPTRLRNNYLHRISGPLSTDLLKTHDNLKFPNDEETESNRNYNKSHKQTEPKGEVETFSETEIHKNPENLQPKDVEKSMANATSAVTANRALGSRNVNVLQKGLTKIEMGINSQVLAAPGMMALLLFEVTNTRTEPIFHNVQVVDERRFLLKLVPQSLFLQPGETATVTVTLLVPNGTPQGTIDRITFTCHGGGTASLSLNLKVITTVDAQDTTSPAVSWTFGNRCEYVPAESPNCGERFWTMDITAQDWETGIMRLQTTPPSGLIYRNTYTVGSTEPLKATYIATCCEPKVSIIAYDVAGNQRSYNVDVRDLVLTEAAIAAIVLGALLLILLIALLIASIVWCCRRRKVVLDLPTYRSHSTRSME